MTTAIDARAAIRLRVLPLVSNDAARLHDRRPPTPQQQTRVAEPLIAIRIGDAVRVGNFSRPRSLCRVVIEAVCPTETDADALAQSIGAAIVAAPFTGLTLTPLSDGPAPIVSSVRAVIGRAYTLEYFAWPF